MRPSWRGSIRSGSWQGVALQGLVVAAAVRAKGTLGDPTRTLIPPTSVLLVDDQRDAEPERRRLAGFAQQMGGEF